MLRRYVCHQNVCETNFRPSDGIFRQILVFIVSLKFTNLTVNAIKNPENRDKIILLTYPSTQNFTRKSILSELRSKPARVVHAQTRQSAPFTLVLDVTCDNSWQSYNQTTQNKATLVTFPVKKRPAQSSAEQLVLRLTRWHQLFRSTTHPYAYTR